MSNKFDKGYKHYIWTSNGLQDILVSVIREIEDKNVHWGQQK